MRSFINLIFLLLGLAFLLSYCSDHDGNNGNDIIDEDNSNLIITEVGSCAYINFPSWIEVYNNSSDTAVLSNYQYRTTAYLQESPYTGYTEFTFILPSLNIPPGSYALIRGKSNTSDELVNGERIVYIVNSDNIAPAWTGNGFAELIRDGITVDFVRFGTNTTSPVTPGAWDSTSAQALPTGTGNMGYSIARDGNNSDTNSAADWEAHDFATPGGPNDVSSNTDADLDGIPDSCEVSGSTFAGLPLYTWGARTGQKDIFIQIDYMQTSDEGVTPRKEALDMVKLAFENNGYYIHFDVGDLFDSAQGIDLLNYDLDDSSHQVPFAAGIEYGESGDSRANFYDYKYNYMDLARKQIFHYMLFANSQELNGAAGSSGIAEINGNDVIISLGGWGLNSGTTSETNKLINYQAGTVMHEFGHNLGLMHGGDTITNYMPNYISIMNYLYQLYGLPTIGTSEGDRYNYYYGYDSVTLSSLVNGPYGSYSNFIIDYSDGTGSNINETAIDESAGLGRTGSNAVDYNDNDITDGGTYSLDINNTGSTETLSDYDDWSNIDLFFIRTYSGDAEGLSPESSNLQIVADPIGDDRQEIIIETLYPPE